MIDRRRQMADPIASLTVALRHLPSTVYPVPSLYYWSQPMESDLSQKPSHLFTMRIWREENVDENEEGENPKGEWRGRIYLASTNEVRHFRDWASLIPVLLSMLKNADGE
ncbi:MAG: hypothetical protein WAU10_04160 [Caldilineaceae bacterium]